MELQKIIRRSIQTKKGKIFQLTEEDEPRKARTKPQKMNRRRDKSADKLADINGALDRM
jgi:hypothetical protein